MKEINEYTPTRGILSEIADNPNFNDEMRNNASDLCYYIKSKELKLPTHEEIMTKWWFIGKSLLWKRVETMNMHYEYFITGTGWLHRSWFIDKKSADIPPEG